MVRLQRKKLKHRLRVRDKQRTLKKLLFQPVIKNVDVEAIKKEFETLAANRHQQKKVEPIKKVEYTKAKSTAKSKKESSVKHVVNKTKKEAKKISIFKNKKINTTESVDQKNKTETSQVEEKISAKNIDL